MSSAMPLTSLSRMNSRFPPNSLASVDLAVSGREGMLSLLLLRNMWKELRGLPLRLPAADRARSQNALSLSSGFEGGCITSLPAAVLTAARVGSAWNSPVTGPLKDPGVVGRGVADELVVAVRGVFSIFARAERGVGGLLPAALEAASFFSSRLAICSSGVSSSVVSPSSSACR